MNFKRICAMAVAEMLAVTSFNVGNVTAMAAESEDEIIIETVNEDTSEDFENFEEFTSENEFDVSANEYDAIIEDSEIDLISEEEKSETDTQDQDATFAEYSDIILKANGGVFRDGSSEYVYNTDTYFNQCFKEYSAIPSREGYAFTGWYADEACTEQLNGEDSAYSISSDKIRDVLYAGWTKDYYTVTYDGNGGKLAEGTNPIEDEDGYTVYEPYNLEDKRIYLIPKGKSYEYIIHYVSPYNVAPENMSLMYWNTDSNGNGQKYGALNWNKTVPTEDLYLYAIYGHIYKLTFKALDGSFPQEHFNGLMPQNQRPTGNYSEDGKTCVITASEGTIFGNGWWAEAPDFIKHYLYYPDDPQPSKDGELFLGWCLDEKLTKVLTKEEFDDYNVTGDAVFYAKYGTEGTTPEDPTPEDPTPEESALTGNMKDVKIAGLKTTVSYTGSALKLSDLFNANDKTCKKESWNGVTLYITDKKTKATTALKEGRDFTVSFGDKINVGKTSVTFTGINGFTGTITKVITIKAANVAKDFEVSVADTVYSKSGNKPSVTVTYAGKTLEAGKDYTVTYKNNKKVASSNDGKKAPYVVVKAKGNYAGTSAKKTFTISKANVSELKMDAKDIAFKANGKKGYFLAKPTFTDNDKKVTVGKNKDIKATYTYTYAAETTLKDGTVRNVGDEVNPKDKLTGPTSIKVTAQIEAGSAKSNYEGTTTLEYTYNVVK